MREHTKSARTESSERTSGSEHLLSDVTKAKRNAPTYDAIQKRILLKHHRYAGLRPSAEAPSRRCTRSGLGSHCFRASTPELLHV